MFLQTERIILRKMIDADFDDYCAYTINNPEQDRMMGRALMDTAEAVRSNFNWLKDREPRGYVLIYKPEDKVIGNLTVYDQVPENISSRLPDRIGKSLSFCLSSAYRRQGFMEETLRAVIAQLFQKESVDYIHCGCFDYNLASQALQEKLGFTYLASTQFTIEDTVYTGIESILQKQTQDG